MGKIKRRTVNSGGLEKERMKIHKQRNEVSKQLSK